MRDFSDYVPPPLTDMAEGFLSRSYQANSRKLDDKADAEDAFEDFMHELYDKGMPFAAWSEEEWLRVLEMFGLGPEDLEMVASMGVTDPGAWE